MRPAIAVCGIGEDLEGAIRKDQPGAGMVGESCFPGGMMGADDAQDRIAVGQTERRKPKPLCRDHQFFEVRSSAQEGEVRLHDEFAKTRYGTARDGYQAKIPCMNQRGGAPSRAVKRHCR